MEKDNNGSKGWGYGGILFLIFLTLKLANLGIVASWSWWWVFSPIWIPTALVIVFVIILGLIEIFKK